MMAADGSAAIELILIAVAAIVGVGGIGATVWAAGKVKGLELTVDLLSKGNEALRAELLDGERRHSAELERFQHERRAGERAAAERIARLEGHNAALVDGIAEKLAKQLGDRLEAAIGSAVDRIVAASAGE